MELLIKCCYWSFFLTSPLHNIIFSHSLSLFAAEQASKWNPTNNTRGGRGGEGKRYFHHNTVLTSQYNTTSSKVRTKDHYFRLWAKRLKCFQNTGVVEGSDLRQKKKCYFFNINRPYNFFQLFSVLARVLIVMLYEKQCQSKSVSSIFWQNKQVITRLELCQRNLHDPIFGHFLVKIGQNV